MQGLLGESARFLAPFPSGIDSVREPTFQLRVARKSERKFRVQLDGAGIKLLALFEFPEIFNGTLEIMCLDKGQIGFAILCRFAFHERFFRVGQFRLERVCDFVREIALDSKDIGQIAVVIVRPSVLVAGCVDQLHVDPHLVSGTPNAAFENI